MKKLISLLGAISIIATSSVSVVACNAPEKNNGNRDFQLETNSISITTLEPGFIKIVNFDALIDEESLPSTFEYDIENVVEVTLSKEQKGLIITPITEETTTVKVKVKSAIHTEEITVNVNKLEEESEFKLDKNQITANTNTIQEIKIINWDYLAPANRPSVIEFSDPNLASAKIDSANKTIKIKINGKITENQKLIMTIRSKNDQEEKVEITINQGVINLENEEIITNIIAGNIVAGKIDTSYAIGDPGYTITEESILDSFNQMNQFNLTDEDIDLEKLTEGQNGQGDIYTISSSGKNENVEGAVELVLNSSIDPNDYFQNKNLGEIRLFSGAYKNLTDILESKRDKVSLAAIIFENVGARNPVLEYAKKNFVKDMGAAGQDVMKNAITTPTTFTINGMPDLGGIFLPDQNVEFTFKFVEEDRITFYEALPESKKIDVEKDLIEDKTPEGQVKLRTEVYNNLSDEFKEKVNLDHFLEFSKVIYDSPKSVNDKTKVTKIDILPGSDILYGHDGAAFNGYINSDPSVGIITGGGNLEKYEENGKLEEKYKAGMGWFTIQGSISGDFYQGHDVFNVIE